MRPCVAADGIKALRSAYTMDTVRQMSGINREDVSLSRKSG
jgi:hypothetical protein